MCHTQNLDVSHSQELSHLYGENFTRPWSPQDFQELLIQENVHALGMFMGARMIGFLVWSCVVDEAEIYTIFVDTDYRRRGLAESLLTEMEKNLLLHGVRSVFLEVAEDNIHGISFYLNNSFLKNGIRKKYYKKNDDEYLDAIIMSKNLKL